MVSSVLCRFNLHEDDRALDARKARSHRRKLEMASAKAEEAERALRAYLAAQGRLETPYRRRAVYSDAKEQWLLFAYEGALARVVATKTPLEELQRKWGEDIGR